MSVFLRKLWSEWSGSAVLQDLKALAEGRRRNSWNGEYTQADRSSLPHFLLFERGDVVPQDAGYLPFNNSSLGFDTQMAKPTDQRKKKVEMDSLLNLKCWQFFNLKIHCWQRYTERAVAVESCVAAWNYLHLWLLKCGSSYNTITGRKSINQNIHVI